MNVINSDDMDASTTDNACVRVMMRLPRERLGDVRKEFVDRGDNLSLEDFVASLFKYIETKPKQTQRGKDEDSIRLIRDLCELFEQIDVNGDGNLQWEEFTQFVVEVGRASDAKQTPVSDYFYAENESFVDTTSIRPLRIIYVQNLRKLFVLLEEKPVIQIYDPHTTIELDSGCAMQLLKEFSPPTMYKDLTIGDTVAHLSPVLAIEYLEGLDMLAISAGDVNVSLWEAKELLTSSSPKQSSAFYTKTPQRILRWGGTSNILFSSGSELSINAWDITVTPKGTQVTLQYQCIKHTDLIQDILFVKEFGALLSAALDKLIYIWNAATGQYLGSRKGHKQGVRCMAYGGNGTVLSAGFEYDIYAWDISGVTDEALFVLRGHHAPITALAVIPAQKQAISLDTDGVFRWWTLHVTTKDIDTDRCIQTFTAKKDGLTRWCPSSFTVISPGGSLVATGYKMKLFEPVSAKPPEHASCTALYNHVSRTFLTTTDRDIKVWDANSGTVLHTFANISGSEITCVVFDGRQRKFVLCNQTGEVNLHNYLNGVLMHNFEKHDSEVTHAIYCNDVGCVLTASWDRSIRVYDECDSRDLLRCVQNAHGGDITALAYSSRHSLVASAAVDGLIRVWDFCFMSLESSLVYENACDVSVLTFLDPYPLLLSGDVEGKIRLWTVRPWSDPATPRYSEIAQFRNYGSKEHLPTNDLSKLLAEAQPPSTPCAVTLIPLAKSANQEPQASDGAGMVIAFGDEQGSITLWDFSALRERLGIKASNTRSSMVFNHKRKIRRDQSEAEGNGGGTEGGGPEPTSGGKSPPAAKRSSIRASVPINVGIPGLASDHTTPSAHPTPPKIEMQIQTASPPKASRKASFMGKAQNPIGAQLIRSWKAHDKDIKSLQWLEHQSALLSCSSDKMVKIWSYEGFIMGVLTRNEAGASHVVRYAWKFPVDTTSELDKARQRAEQIYKKVISGKQEKSGSSRKWSRNPEDNGGTGTRQSSVQGLGLTGGTTNGPTANPLKIRNSTKSSLILNSKEAVATFHHSSIQISNGEIPSKGDSELSSNKVLRASTDFSSASVTGESQKLPLSGSSEGHRNSSVAASKESQEEYRKRLLGQLQGQQTWVKTPLEIAKEEARKKEQQKHMEAKQQHQNASTAKMTAAFKGDPQKNVMLEYAEVLGAAEDDLSTSELSPSKGGLPGGSRNSVSLRSGQLPKRESTSTSAFADKNNWSIGSLNRQKLMYSNLYEELERTGTKTSPTKERKHSSMIKAVATTANNGGAPLSLGGETHASKRNSQEVSQFTLNSSVVARKQTQTSSASFASQPDQANNGASLTSPNRGRVSTLARVGLSSIQDSKRQSAV